MGVLGRVLKGVERKLDGPPAAAAYVWPDHQAWARLISSERTAGSGAPGGHDESPSMLDDAIGKARGVRYRFELEVHRPDLAPHEIRREERVPSKVEGRLFLASHKIPAGAEVPLRVTGPAEDDVELDWDGYLAIPEQADRAYHLRIEEGRTEADSAGTKRR